MAELSYLTQKLISQYQYWYQSLQPKGRVSTIHVDEVASKVAAFYEKIRGIVDWREEHLMRRAAISRMLKRRLLLAKVGGTIAESLVLELIRGGHFPNDKIPESKIEETQKIIDKYVFILQNSPAPPKEKLKTQFINWLLDIAACEIEEVLSPSKRERALIEYMMESLKESVRVKETKVLVFGGMSEEEKNTQLYVAVQRALLKLDSPIITYHLLKRRYSQWADLPLLQLQEITQNIYSIWDNLEKELNHPLAEKFYKVCEKYDTPYLLLGDILTEESTAEIAEKISKPEILEELIKKVYNKRLSTLKKRLSRAAIYSTLSILLTNALSLYILEIPLAKLITGTFRPITIVVDILGPTFLMFLLTVTIKPPSKSNLQAVIMETMKIVYQREKVDIYEIKVSKKKGVIVKFLIVLLYLIGALISLGVIVAIFQWAGFPPTSVVINIIFVALIAFAGLAIRNRAEELTVEEKRVSFVGFLFDILFLPVVGLGRWMSNKWKKYNAIAAFFTALIDMPFQLFVEFFEQWRFFLKEKKEEIH